MYTEYFGPVEGKHLRDFSSQLEKAARKLQQGGLLAFPTETVYGLGASILNEQAIHRLFRVKQRPKEQALPIFVANFNQLRFIASEIPEEAHRLSRLFLPGPLTLILKRNCNLSSSIVGGMETVAIRISSNPIARRLIELTGCPLALTSANRSGKPSSLKAQHVLEDLNGQIEGIVDGGETEFGIESTLLSLVDPDKPQILRTGVISKSQIEGALGKPVSLHPKALILMQGPIFKDLKSAVRLFSTWEEIKLYIRMSPKSKRLIMSDEEMPIPVEEFFLLNDKNLYEGLRIAEWNGYSEVIVHCSPRIKKNLLLLNRLKQIART